MSQPFRVRHVNNDMAIVEERKSGVEVGRVVIDDGWYTPTNQWFEGVPVETLDGAAWTVWMHRYRRTRDVTTPEGMF